MTLIVLNIKNIHIYCNFFLFSNSLLKFSSCVDYLESVSCFRQFSDNMPACYEEAQRMFLDYRIFITQFDAEDELKPAEERREEENRDESITYSEPYCL